MHETTDNTNVRVSKKYSWVSNNSTRHFNLTEGEIQVRVVM